MTAPHSPLDADVEALVSWLNMKIEYHPSAYYSGYRGSVRSHLATVKRMAERIAELEREARGFSGPLGEVPSTARRK